MISSWTEKRIKKTTVECGVKRTEVIYMNYKKGFKINIKYEI